MIRFGPTREFSLGSRINAVDTGGLVSKFTVIRERRVAVMEFGVEGGWLAATPPVAREMAAVMCARCTAAFGPLRYDKSRLPVRVVANKAKGVVELYLPKRMSALGANPEFWMALAEVMDTTAKSMYN